MTDLRPQKGNFGASHPVYGADGAPIQVLEWTEEICKACEENTGGTKFGIYRETGGSASLVCPNCGEAKHVFSNRVKRVGQTRTIPAGAQSPGPAKAAPAPAETAPAKTLAPTPLGHLASAKLVTTKPKAAKTTSKPTAKKATTKPAAKKSTAAKKPPTKPRKAK